MQRDPPIATVTLMSRRHPMLQAANSVLSVSSVVKTSLCSREPPTAAELDRVCSPEKVGRSVEPAAVRCEQVVVRQSESALLTEEVESEGRVQGPRLVDQDVVEVLQPEERQMRENARD